VAPSRTSCTLINWRKGERASCTPSTSLIDLGVDEGPEEAEEDDLFSRFASCVAFDSDGEVGGDGVVGLASGRALPMRDKIART
jgi:hypothetical protein